MSTKKWSKYLNLLLLLCVVSLVLSGCVNRDTSSFSYRIFAAPINGLIDWCAGIFNGNYGWSLILIVSLVRFILLPLTLRQQEAAIKQSVKQRRLQPHLQAFQERLNNATTQEEKMRIQQEQMTFMRENNFNLIGGVTDGCLPLLIQLPIISGLYIAIQTSENIRQFVFFGISLGQSNLVLAILTIILYFIQGWVSLQAVPEEQRKQQRMIMMTMPLTMAFIVFSVPAGLTLYFVTAAFWTTLQSVYTTYVYRPRITERVEKELENTPIKNAPTTPVPNAKDVTDSVTEKKKTLPSSSNKKRNAGKQSRHK